MKKIGVVNLSDATERFALMLVSEAFGQDRFEYKDIVVIRTRNTDEQENYKVINRNL